MQASAADIQHLKNKGDEDAINFRPSPNFKHMKKYLKSKFEEANASSAGEQGIGEEEEKVNGTSGKMLQPPLPPNPPPPDSPPHITLKKEVVDEDFQNNEEPKNQSESEEHNNDFSNKTETRKDKIMCRQFARGACTRGASCIYAHELILDQLRGIYTFCKNYQNRGCNFAKCIFVHATVFEKEAFYRTGFLPPHCLAHLKENNATQPSNPMPEGGQPEVPSAFPNPPPTPVVLPGTSGASGGGEARGSEALSALAAAAAAISPRKLGAAAARDTDIGEPMPKKCKNCDINEFRLQCNKNKIEKLKRSTEEIDKKMALLNKKNDKLYCFVTPLLINSQSTKSGGTHTINKEKTFLQVLKMFFTSNRLSLLDEDSNLKSIMSMLMRMLLKTRDENTPSRAPGDS